MVMRVGMHKALLDDPVVEAAFGEPPPFRRRDLSSTRVRDTPNHFDEDGPGIARVLLANGDGWRNKSGAQMDEILKPLAGYIQSNEGIPGYLVTRGKQAAVLVEATT